ncbi:17247_t:CDS:1 [Acaulospora morrowiae]|uniref:17247_t:CDS:1 n=1 Tax=Acaulospora morrowiae TaxID=94023 RepID=A0A9N8WBI4_9GLOM|nr:17247_t:CDS:1 [Acaulospora morrowiae]
MTQSESPQEENVPNGDPPPYTSSVTLPSATHIPQTASNAESIQNPEPSVVYQQEPTVCYIVQNNILPTQLPIDLAPVSMYCPRCGNYITTQVFEIPGSTTYCYTIILCFLFWPLAWLPFYMSSCQDKVHRCPSCGNTVAVVCA